MTIGQFLGYVGNGSAITLLCMFIYAAVTGNVIFKRESDKDERHKLELLGAKDEVIEDLRRQLAASQKEKDEWRGMALRGAHLAGKGLDLAAATATGGTTTG